MGKTPPLALPVVLLVGVLVGVLIGPLVSPGAADQPAPGTSHQRGAAQDEAQRDRSTRLTSPGADATRRAPAPGASAAERLTDEVLDAARAELGDEPAAAGDLAIRGRVLSLRGEPLPGAQVVLARETGNVDWNRGEDTSEYGVGEARSDRAWLAEQARQIARKESARHEVRSGPDGTFEVAALADGTYRVEAYLDGHNGEQRRVGAGGEVDLFLERIGVFHLEPRMPSGEVAEVAAILLDTGGRSIRLLRWSREDPYVRLPERAATLGAVGGRWVRSRQLGAAGTHASEPRLIDLDADGAGPHVLELEPRTALLVRVDRPAEDSGPVIVTAQRVDGEGEPRRMESFERDGYVLPDVEPAVYEVVARRQSAGEPGRATVEVTDAWTEASVELPGLDRADHLIVRAYGPDGAMLRDVNFSRSVSREGGGQRDGTANALDKPDGSFWISWSEFIPDDPSEAVERRSLSAHSEVYGTRILEVSGPDQDLEFRFGEPATCTVRVTGEIGDQTTLRVFPREARGLHARTGSKLERVPRSGAVDLGRMQPGDHEFRLGSGEAGGGQVSGGIAKRIVTLAPGPNEVLFDIPERTSLEVRLPADASSFTTWIEKVDPVNSWDRTTRPSSTDDGIARFDGLIPGTYQVITRADGERVEMLVEVPSAPVVFDPMPVTGLVVVRPPTRGPFGAIDLRPGDVIEGFGGRAADGDGFFEALAHALVERDVTLRLERDGRATTVRLERDETATRDDLRNELQARSRLR